MGIGAWLMLVFGAVVLYGGFLWCLMIANRKKPVTQELKQDNKPPEAD